MLRISPRRRISSWLYLLLWTVSPPLYPVRASGQRTEYLTISTAVTPSKSDSIEREASRVVVPMLIDANVVKKSRQIFLSATFFSKNEFGNPAFEERNKIVFFPKPLSQNLQGRWISLSHTWVLSLLGVGWLAFTTESLSWPLIFFLSSQLQSLTHSVHCVGHSHTHTLLGVFSLPHSLRSAIFGRRRAYCAQLVAQVFSRS